LGEWEFEERKIAWIVWDKICLFWDAGSLDIINVRQFNMTLLRK